MNRTVMEGKPAAFHYETPDSLKAHLDASIIAYTSPNTSIASLLPRSKPSATPGLKTPHPSYQPAPPIPDQNT